MSPNPEVEKIHEMQRRDLKRVLGGLVLGGLGIASIFIFGDNKPSLLEKSLALGSAVPLVVGGSAAYRLWEDNYPYPQQDSTEGSE